MPGGQLMITSEVENYPGFADGILGPKLMGEMRAQASRVGAEIITRRVSSVNFQERPFHIGVGSDDYRAKVVIVAIGAQARMLGLPSEGLLLGRGVSTCATCDGFFFKGKNVVVVGGGDAALEEALYLANIVGSVTIVHRRGELRASRILQERAFRQPNLQIRWNSIVAEILGDRRVTGVKLEDTLTGNSDMLPSDAVFVAIGHVPATQLFEGQLKLNEAGYIVTGDGTATSVDGVFACGDVQDEKYRQAITAAGSGCMAAIDVERWLQRTHVS
jgi:thioredoxin reductase (NADPH)